MPFYIDTHLLLWWHYSWYSVVKFVLIFFMISSIAMTLLFVILVVCDTFVGERWCVTLHCPFHCSICVWCCIRYSCSETYTVHSCIHIWQVLLWYHMPSCFVCIRKLCDTDVFYYLLFRCLHSFCCYSTFYGVGIVLTIFYRAVIRVVMGLRAWMHFISFRHVACAGWHSFGDGERDCRSVLLTILMIRAICVRCGMEVCTDAGRYGDVLRWMLLFWNDRCSITIVLHCSAVRCCSCSLYSYTVMLPLQLMRVLHSYICRGDCWFCCWWWFIVVTLMMFVSWYWWWYGGGCPTAHFSLLCILEATGDTLHLFRLLLLMEWCSTENLLVFIVLVEVFCLLLIHFLTLLFYSAGICSV
jgi:hypothetical protein